MVFAVGLLILASVAAVQGITAPNVTVECSETGFEPQITQAGVAGVAVEVTLYIGDYAESPTNGCFFSKTDSSGTGNLVMTKTEYSDDELSYDTIKTTCAEGDFSQNTTHIDFEIPIHVVVAETLRSQIVRKEKFEYALTCHLTRTASESTAKKWTIDESAITKTGTTDDASNTFTFPVALDFYTDANYATAKGATFTAAHGDDLYFKIFEDPASSLFIFQVTECWSTTTPDGTGNVKDIFFTDMCPVDDTVNFVDRVDADADADHTMKFEMKAFYFTGDATDAIYFHCTVKICLQTSPTECAQTTNTVCDTPTFRKRRSILDDVGTGVIDTRTITNKQHILLPQSQISATQCPENSVYDRQEKTCSSAGLMEVQGVYLDQTWDDKFSDPSSVEFQRMAAEKEFQLFSLVQMNDVHRNIRGVKVVRAREGSVVLDVQVVYDPTISSSQAFYTFEKAIQGGSQRISNILSLRREKVIEYIDIVAPSRPQDNEKMILIVIVVVLAAFLFVGVLFGMKFRNMRQVSATSGAVKSFENPTMTA